MRCRRGTHREERARETPARAHREIPHERGYKLKAHPAATPLDRMEPGTFSFRLNVLVKPSKAEAKTVKIPIDAVIQPKKAKLPHLPILIEAKSAGDFTNVNKRRKEEAIKINYLKATYGEDVVFVLFLCGYFDAAYLGYESGRGDRLDLGASHRGLGPARNLTT